MLQEGCVFIGKYDTTFIFRAEGRLTQQSLWNMNTATQKCQDDPEITNLLVDITHCLYMDSTILGLLARWAISFQKKYGTLPFLVGLHDSPLESTFRRMNLNTLFYMSKDLFVNEKSALLQLAQAHQSSQQEYAEFLLTAHQTLTELSPDNAQEFAAVIQCLKAELKVK